MAQSPQVEKETLDSGHENMDATDDVPGEADESDIEDDSHHNIEQDDDEKNEGNGTTNDKDDADNDDGSETEQPVESVALYKSRRFKGYLTILLASIVNYNAAALSDQPLDSSAVPANQAQKYYAQSVSMVSAIVTGVLIVIHLDRYSPLQSLWQRTFQPQSKLESFLLVGLVLWWSVAAIIQTSVRGIAGDGKGQYNLYYSTWVCCWTCLWCAERKMVDFGYPTFRNFVTGWPYRAPGWIAIFMTCFFTLWWYVDLFNSTKRIASRIPDELKPFYEDIPRSQYQWLIFVAAITLLPSLIFFIVEILRDSETVGKGHVETILEGCCLLCLTMGWVPSVIVATTPGGFASAVGNAYFCTWATTVFVLETFLWFLHDWRGSVHQALDEKAREYRRRQQSVLQKTLEIQRRNQEEETGMPQQGYSHNSTEEDEDEGENEEDANRIDDMYKESGEDDDGSAYRLDDYFLGPDDPQAPNSPARIPSDILGGDNNEKITDADSVAQEMRLKKSNPNSYFDTLDDILE